MSSLQESEAPLRVSFRLGPWRSPRSRGWQDAYDLMVQDLSDAGVPIYGVLEADLVGGKEGSSRWRQRFAANAAEVVARYGDRIQAFEILPGSNEPGPDGNPRLSELLFARALAEAYRSIRTGVPGRDVTLIAGAVALYNDGAGYLARMIATGEGSAAWASLRQATHATLPFDAIAVWLELPPVPGPIPAGHFDGQIDALVAALRPLGAVGSMPVYVSGLAWQMQGQGDFDGQEIAAALSALQRDRPGILIASREAPASGPSFETPEELGRPAPLTFAVFTVPDFTVAFAAPAALSVIDGFDFPVGPRDKPDPRKAGYAITTILADPGYFANPKFKGAWHPGEDWAALGTCDAGLGDPIYAIADGVVVFRQFRSPSWGNIILIRHTLRSGAIVWSQYAHLESWLVEENHVVSRGQQIGTLGKGAHNAFCAHLHFEIRNGDLRADTWFPLVRDKKSVLANYLPPTAFISGHRPASFPDRRGVIVDNEPRQQETGTFTRTETPGHWFRSYFGWNDTADVTYASSLETDWGEWRPQLPAAGRYQVQAWIPSRHATTHNAVYAIHHAGGVTEKAIDQNAFSDQWVSLGAHEFGHEGALVRLTDKTGEPDKERLEVCFDAVRWLPAEAG